MLTSFFVYAALWFSFGLVHSILARSAVQQKLRPIFGKYYRLFYNLFAVLHIGVVFYVGKSVLSISRFNAFSMDPIPLLFLLIAIAGGILIVVALRQYDLGLFSGISQLKQGESATELPVEPLSTHGLNHWVRHPLYSGAFLFLWGNAISMFGLATAIFGSIYLVVGARYEERKLTTIYGEAYRHYQSTVPAFFPRIR